MKKKLKIISKILLSLFFTIAIGFYILVDTNLPKLKTEKLDMGYWEYSKIKDLKFKRSKADSLFNLKNYVASEDAIKSITTHNDYELRDLITLCKIYSVSEQKDSLIKYLNFYIENRNKTSVSLLYASNNIDIDSIIFSSNNKSDRRLISLKNKLSSYVKEKEKKLDTILIKELKYMLEDDQNSRTNNNKENKDLINQKKLERIINEKGIPKISTVGTIGIVTLFAIIQHSDNEFIEKHFEEIEKQTTIGEFPKELLAYLIDRRNIWKGIPQVFGTQITMSSPFSIFSKQMKLWKIADENNVDLRRYAYGLEPIENYKKMNNL